jgi:hypothetical protein
MMADLTDDENLILIKRALTGEESALAALFDGYRDRLRRMIRLRPERRLAARFDLSDVRNATKPSNRSPPCEGGGSGGGVVRDQSATRLQLNSASRP